MADENLYRRSGTYYARVQVSGRDVRRSLRTSDRAVARKRLRDILEEAKRARSGIIEPTVAVWEDAIERWTATKLPSLRPASALRYSVSLKALNAVMGGMPLLEIKRAVVSSFVAKRQAAGTSTATVRRDLNVLSMVIEEAIEAEMLPDGHANPVTKIRRKLVERRDPIRPVSSREIASVVRAAPPTLKPLIRFLARTGCRREEAASLDWAQVKLSQRQVTFVHTKTRSPRAIEISRQAARDLARLSGPDRGHVFRASTGERYYDVSGAFHDAVVASGSRPFRCHDLRHTFAIRWLEQGGTIYQLARHLGHSTVATTEAYARWLVRRPD